MALPTTKMADHLVEAMLKWTPRVEHVTEFNYMRSIEHLGLADEYKAAMLNADAADAAVRLVTKLKTERYSNCSTTDDFRNMWAADLKESLLSAATLPTPGPGIPWPSSTANGASVSNGVATPFTITGPIGGYPGAGSSGMYTSNSQPGGAPGSSKVEFTQKPINFNWCPIELDFALTFTSTDNGQLITLQFIPEPNISAMEVLKLNVLFSALSDSAVLPPSAPIQYLRKYNLERHFKFSV